MPATFPGLQPQETIRVLAVAGATNLLLVTFLIPVSARVLGTAFLGETITLQAIGGRLWRLARGR